MIRGFRAAAVGALAVAALAVAAPWVAGAFAVEVWWILPHPPSKVELNRGLFALDAPDPASPDHASKVMEIYGNPTGEPIRVLFVPDSELLRPEELPSLALLPVDPEAGRIPLQARTVRFVARRVALGAAVAGLALLAASLRFRSRRAAA